MIERAATQNSRIIAAECPLHCANLCRRKQEHRGIMVTTCPHLAGLRSTEDGLVVQCSYTEE